MKINAKGLILIAIMLNILWIDAFGQKKPKQSLFATMYAMDGMPTVEINTDYGLLWRKSAKMEYQDGTIVVKDLQGQSIAQEPARIRARGNMRKKVCAIPPIKIDFDKSVLDSIGFRKIDDLKCVFPCRDRDSDQDKLYREHFCYELYNILDTIGLRSKLVHFVILDESKPKYDFFGILLEDESDYSHRLGAEFYSKSTTVNLKAQSLHKPSFDRMQFFQYMIMNTDWSIDNRHNIELVKLKSMQQAAAIPYDYDYSGFVGQSYAIPHESLPIKTIQERYFFSYPVTESEFKTLIDHFLSKEKEMIDLCQKATYMSEKERKYAQEFIEDFMKLLRDPDRIRGDIFKK